MKTCIKCGSQFDGKFCKPCKKLYLKEYRAKNKAKMYAVESAWRKLHPEAVKATKQRWKDKNPTSNKEYYEKAKHVIRARVKKWVEENKERSAEYKKQYNKKNPEVRVNGKAKRRIRIGGDKLPYGTIPKKYALQNGKCACCGISLGDKYHVDHIMPLALGGKNVPENIQLLTQKCNQQKSAKHPIDFMQERGFLL
jgi:5-methylcytosine-specific restriction endonuclease McrA